VAVIRFTTVVCCSAFSLGVCLLLHWLPLTLPTGVDVTAYYNEIDPYAAEWLRNLILMGEIAPGVVDERSIEDVTPYELREFTQCHFFAGIGVWSLALRNAGWPDDRPVWTGSCPCQPFSAAGKSNGFDDERHLWPYWHWLISECRPTTVFGEQVASKAAEPWIDLVQTDMEGMDYAFGCVPFPSAGIGVPHIRDRTYWVGHTNKPGSQRFTGDGSPTGRERSGGSVTEASVSGRVADTRHQRRDGGALLLRPERGGREKEDLPKTGRGISTVFPSRDTADQSNVGPFSSGTPAGPTNGFWRDTDWLFCRDGKWRPVEPGTFPLVNGAASRVGRLRAYGNAINAEQAKVFIETVMVSI